MEESILMKDILRTVKKYLWLIVILTIIGGIIGKLLVPAGPAPTYKAASLILIEKGNTNETNVIINQTDEMARFINTALTLVYTPAILETVIQDLKLDTTSKKLAKQVNAEVLNNSKIIQISATDSNAKSATEIANKAAEVFEKDINKYLDVKSVDIIEKAELDNAAQIVHSRSNANTVMGIILGLVIGTFMAFILKYFKRSN